MDLLLKSWVIGTLLGVMLVCVITLWLIKIYEKSKKEATENFQKNFKKCPDCAQPINKAARVCLVCGWRKADSN